MNILLEDGTQISHPDLNSLLESNNASIAGFSGWNAKYEGENIYRDRVNLEVHWVIRREQVLKLQKSGGKLNKGDVLMGAMIMYDGFPREYDYFYQFSSDEVYPGEVLAFVADQPYSSCAVSNYRQYTNSTHQRDY